ncbi:MAG TPA: hypothetical protein V6D05_03210 [Stenomitos sp.]
MPGSLANCTRCSKAFTDYTGRGMCPTCFGQKIFGKAAAEIATPAAEELRASQIGLHSPDHSLRCDVYAQKGRAHGSTTRRGAANFW